MFDIRFIKFIERRFGVHFIRCREYSECPVWINNSICFLTVIYFFKTNRHYEPYGDRHCDQIKKFIFQYFNQRVEVVVEYHDGNTKTATMPYFLPIKNA
jgi:hypothetical protein